MDPRARRGLIILMREMSITMLVSTHDLAMVHEVFPRMVIMNNGRIVADGQTSEPMKDEKLLMEHGLEKV